MVSKQNQPYWRIGAQHASRLCDCSTDSSFPKQYGYVKYTFTGCFVFTHKGPPRSRIRLQRYRFNHIQSEGDPLFSTLVFERICA